ncbi:MAG: MinD/ParA family protein [Bdellovibrionales bacterium]|jgi:flagellar biosynthesis protein FlhG|nr:MinD/ParA family protein [Bdellovibrionales bacterium]
MGFGAKTFSSDLTGRSTRVISITSGKGGVGKSTIVANLAAEFDKRGQRVLMFDGDLGMANLDIMFQVKPKYSVANVLSGEVELKDILVHVSPSLTLIPGGTGLFELQKLPIHAKQVLLDQVSDLGTIYDIMLIDTAPGIADNVLYLNSAAQEIVVTLTPDPSSLTDAYALIKVLHQRQRESKFSVVCNQVRDEADGRRVFERLQTVAAQFLPVTLSYRGSIPSDPHLRQCTRGQQVICRAIPQAESARAISTLADALLENAQEMMSEVECKGSLQFFWRQLIGAA